MTVGIGRAPATLFNLWVLVRSIDGFEVVEGSGSSGRLRLRHEGRELPQLVPGAVLEAQFRVPPEGSVLLLLTDDVPYEETLHVVLLDADGRLLEHQRVSEAMTPGVLGDLRSLGPRALDFRFWPGRRHQLRIHPRPQGRLRKRWMTLDSSPEDEGETPP